MTEQEAMAAVQVEKVKWEAAKEVLAIAQRAEPEQEAERAAWRAWYAAWEVWENIRKQK